MARASIGRRIFKIEIGVAGAAVVPYDCQSKRFTGHIENKQTVRYSPTIAYSGDLKQLVLKNSVKCGRFAERQKKFGTAISTLTLWTRPPAPKPL